MMVIVIIIIMMMMMMTMIIIITMIIMVENRGKKDEDKTLKYGPLRWELKAQYKGYKINQYNVIIDVLGGWSVDMERSLRVLLGSSSREVLRLMQRSVISSTLHIARTFKVAA